ncbi:alpha/beta fold hydrolase [Paenibacillus sp. NEAU-GSW1]|uniref:alpha/beta fold hydrolase n=1 Tax=Paenibacillus sp. NEAU-GSW1 TaxID=2682486 RepID=UPI0012E22337|nr:alpha/beta hydrolase [Paenibacillus sp. NEAU-GSW1]
MTGQFLQLQDCELYYSVAGSGRPLILLHGNFNDHRIWDSQANALAQSYQVIRYDLRGYGFSGTPSAGYSNVDDLLAVFNHLQLEKAVLIGSSSGGAVAIDFTLAYPHRVESLILAAPSVSGRSYPLQMTWNGIKNYSAFRSKGAEAAIEAFIQNRFWQYFFPESHKPAALEQVLSNVRNPNNFCRISPKLITPPKPPAAKRLQQIKCPTLLIAGDRDHPYNRSTTDLLQKRIQDAVLTVIADCGHLPFVEEAAQFNQLVIDFLSKS